MGNSSRKEKRPGQVQDERGNTGTLLPTPPPDAEQAPQAQHKHGETETPPPNAGTLVCECSEDDGMKSTGPVPEHVIAEIPSTSGNQPSAIVTGTQPPLSGSQLSGSGPQPPGSGPQAPGSGPQPPGSEPQPPGSEPQPPGTGPQPPGLEPQPPLSGPQAPGSGSQPPGSGPQPPGSGPQPPGSGPEGSTSVNNSDDNGSTSSSNDPCSFLGNGIQENDQNSNKEKKLNPDDALEKLWDDQYFRDDLCLSLDFTHSKSDISDYRHLIQEFDIPVEDRDKMSFQKESPTENMFEYLKSKEPLWKISDLCKVLHESKAHKTCRYLQNALKEKKFAVSDCVCDVLDKDLDVRTTIITLLDYTGHWKQVSDKQKIPLEKWSLFERDSTSNPAQTFFELLWTQSPALKLSKLKFHLWELGEEGLVQKMLDISGEEPLTILRSKASLMYDEIQPKLNAPNNTLLMKLAEAFKKESYLKDVDIQIFKTNESYESPTFMMMDYVLYCQETEYKIQDLVDKLKKIRRFDTCGIIAKYVKGLHYKEIGGARAHIRT